MKPVNLLAVLTTSEMCFSGLRLFLTKKKKIQIFVLFYFSEIRSIQGVIYMIVAVPYVHDFTLVNVKLHLPRFSSRK